MANFAALCLLVANSVRNLSNGILFAAGLILVVVLQTSTLPGETRIEKEFLNAGHIFSYGVLSILALRTSVQLFVYRVRKHYQHYTIALAVTLVIGSITELLQIWVARDADLSDVGRDVLGAVCFLTIYSVRDSRLTQQWQQFGRRTRNVVMVCAITILVAALMPLFTWSVAYAYRDQAFPEIVSFTSYWSCLFVNVQDAKLVVTERPVGWTTTQKAQVGRLTLQEGRYPGLEVQYPYPDWSKHRYLRFGIYSEMTKPIQLTIRIHDRGHNNEYRDRFNQALTVLPGSNEYRIHISKIRAAPATRELDVRNVASLSVFAVYPREPYIVDIDAIWLE